jgi:peptide/nickel transport system substrate-binding protein
MKHLKSVLFFILLILLTALVGCSGSQESSSTTEAGEKTETASTTENGEKVLTIANGSDMVSFDIHNHQATQTQAIHVNMFDSLIEKDEKGNFVPDLADSWTNIDELTWEFKLNPNATFHNGDPVLAKDVKYTLERVATDESLLEHKYYNQIKEVKIIDDHTVHIVTHGPDPILLSRISRQGSGILPADYIETNGWDHFLKNPIGAGPYKFVEWKKDNQLVIEKYEDYYKYDPKWDKVVFRVIPENSTRVAELLTGGVDIALNVPPSDWERVEDNEGTHMINSDTHRIMQLVLRLTEGNATADPKVREAIELAIDSELIVDTLLGGAGIVTRTGVTPVSFGGNEELYGQNQYDPEKAKQLLKEAGYENGLDLTLSVSNGRYLKDKETGELIQAMLAEVGINVNLEVLEWSKWIENYNAKSFKEMYMVGYANSLGDASNPLGLVYSDKTEGETDYNNPKVDQLLDAAQFNMNPEERAAQYNEVQEILAEDRVRIYLFTLNQVIGVSDDIDFKANIDEWTIVDQINLKQ